MKILVANIGSTSFKYRLYAMPEERLLARGGVERIGSAEARSYLFLDAGTEEKTGPVADHGAALAACLEQLADLTTGCLAHANELSAIGFKAVHAGKAGGIRVVDDALLAAMDEFTPVAPAHNPPYVDAMRQLRAMYPDLPLVAAFETAFHETIPPEHKRYAIPSEWHDLGVCRWGFHGASHRFIAGRMAQLMGRDDLRLISCHLGGSSSLSAIVGGKSVGNSLGMSPQSGLPHNNRVGDFDIFALPFLMRATGKTIEQILGILASSSGLMGVSGAGNDLRDIEQAASAGNGKAALAIGVFVSSIRDYLGSYLVRMGGANAIAFTGGIGENSAAIRAAVCGGLEGFGIALDSERNRNAKGECRVSAAGSATEIWILPTNEELVVARQTFEALAQRGH